jgi:flagellar hook-associated protein FlgK
MTMAISSGASATAIGLSGMRAAQRSLDTSAHNIANGQTPGFQRQMVAHTAQPGIGGVNTEVRRESATAPQQNGDGLAHMAADVVGQRVSLYSFAANLKAVQTQDRMMGSLLDAMA